MNIIYECEHCLDTFDDERECEDHEKGCKDNPEREKRCEICQHFNKEYVEGTSINGKLLKGYTFSCKKDVPEFATYEIGKENDCETIEFIGD